MGRLRQGVPLAAVLLLSLASFSGRGGGGSSSAIQPPPPAPDFSLGRRPPRQLSRTDENGQRLLPITSSDGTAQNAAVTVVQLAAVPLGIGMVSPSVASAAGGTTLTIRGSGFQAATTVSINGRTAAVSFKDINTFSVLAPSLTPGPQQIVITNPDGETTSMDAAITVNQITPFSPRNSSNLSSVISSNSREPELK
jgi:hypothetical protein